MNKILLRTDAKNPDFQDLVTALDADLAIRDGADHAFYNQYNGIEAIRYAVVLYAEKRPVACGAVKVFGENAMEVKRMYVLPEVRGRGYATCVLDELERWARELGYQKCLLETGIRQPEAIGLYEKNGYTRIANYGQYAGVESSVCFEKCF